MKDKVFIHWFRQDLRLSDNPALAWASQQGQVLPIFILDDESAADHKLGAASRCWLHHSLKALDKDLQGKLRVYQGKAEEIFSKLTTQYSIAGVSWNRCYELWRSKQDETIKTELKNRGIEVKTGNGSLLWEPSQVLKRDGTPYRVFTPFYRKGCLSAKAPRKPLRKPSRLLLAQGAFEELSIEALELLPSVNWDRQIMPHWTTGEKAAWNKLKRFIRKGLEDYEEGRNYPAKASVSRLSPHLHWGEISPNQVWYEIQAQGEDANVDRLLCELAWREFSYSLLYYNPDLPRKALQDKFNYFPWRKDDKALKRWQMGRTGYPIVDAGMRELWQTGYMHNRVRMIVGSFLVKNLLLHWRDGQAWFWDCLVDADLANNSAGWQWIAGCGADAAPYFRIFNPITQGEKFDPEGEYTRRFVPELSKLPNKFLFKPWEAPKDILEQAEVVLGKNYPEPMVDIKISRQQALDCFSSL